MKKTLLMMGLLLGILNANAQDVDEQTLSKMKLNFVVPDMPAFKSLGTEPSNLLRPSTPQAFAVAFSEFYQDRRLVLPSAFAMEFSPSLLLNAKKDIWAVKNSYADNRILNSFRVSIGSFSDTSVATRRNLSLGFRINLINNGELATDQKELEKISRALAEFRIQSRDCRRQFAIENFETLQQWAIEWGYQEKDAIMKVPVLDSIYDWDLILENKIRTDSTLAAKYVKFSSSCDIAFNEWFKKEKEDYRKRMWNATKLDMALAIVSSSPDSLLGNIQLSKVDFWTTYAIKTGEYSQLLAGVNASSFKDVTDTTATKDDMYFNFAVPVRYLIGTNKVKGFAEIQYKYTGQLEQHNGLFNLGAEISPLDGVWINIYGGIDYNSTTEQGAFRTNLNLKLTLPENFKLF